MTDSEVDIVTQLNENVKKTLETSLGNGYILQHNANGVPMNVRPGFKFSEKIVPKNSNASDNVVNKHTSSPYSYSKLSQHDRRINNGMVNNRFKTNIPAKINQKLDENDIYKIYGQKPTSKHVFTANCKEINLMSSEENYFVYWDEPPRNENDKPFSMTEKQKYLGKHVNLWYGGTISTRVSGWHSLKLYFECFTSKQNEDLTEIFIVCKNVADAEKDITKLKVGGLKFEIDNSNEDSDSDSESGYSNESFESISDEDNVQNGGEPNENDSNDRKITVHLIEYNSTVHKGGSYTANSMGIISGLFVIAICAIFPR
jgi:hypothetical protein